MTDAGTGSVDASAIPDYAAQLRLDGRRFVVLGAGQGIGRQAAGALTAVGARVACVDVESERAARVAAELGGVALSGDMTDRADVQRVFDEADEALGGLDGVVDVIGMARYATVVDVTDDDWAWHFDIVLRHAYLAVQLAGRVLAEHGGVVVFVASASGITSAPRHAAYGAAKAGLMSLVRTAAVELGPAGVRVNAVAPGVVWTPRVSALLGEDGEARNRANTPLRRVALPADIAAAILFLCSDLAGYVTGQTLVVDGGVGAKFPYPMADDDGTA
jgi:NAD(P)-dependent dehydrogenase (short-subunit alcohol dehydrogenase family)